MKVSHLTRPHKQYGVSMVEILVTLIIVAIGLMGMSSMQMLSLKNANSAHFRYQAALLAYDMQERMRANTEAVGAGAYNSVSIDTSGTVSSAPSTPTTSTAIAAQDIYDWEMAMRNSNLPAATGSVTLNNGDYDIQVTWAEQQTGGDLGDALATHETKSFNLTVSL